MGNTPTTNPVLTPGIITHTLNIGGNITDLNIHTGELTGERFTTMVVEFDDVTIDAAVYFSGDGTLEIRGTFTEAALRNIIRAVRFSLS